jgi:hypothetical protein
MHDSETRFRRRQQRLLRERGDWLTKCEALHAALAEQPQALMRAFDLAAARKRLRKIDAELEALSAFFSHDQARERP